jgi:hypothetical protein
MTDESRPVGHHQLLSSKAVLQGLLDEAKGAALGEWNLFNLLREHKACSATQVRGAITLVHWLRIVRVASTAEAQPPSKSKHYRSIWSDCIMTSARGFGRSRAKPNLSR